METIKLDPESFDNIEKEIDSPSKPTSSLIELMSLLSDVSQKSNSMCLGYETNTPNGRDFECGYETTIMCDDCKYGGHGGRKDPEAKCNQQR